MCENCKKELNENEEVELREDSQEVCLEDMSKDELLDIVYNLLEQKNKEININTNNLNNIFIDKKEFEKGIKKYSAVAGAFSVLNSVGYPKDLIHEMILNERTIQHNQILQQMNNTNAEKIAKLQEVKIEQQQI